METKYKLERLNHETKIEKTKALRLHIVTISLQLWALITNHFRKNRATHVFYFSEKQLHCCDGFFKFDRMPNPDVRFKGKPYTEMREFKHGFSNWDDAKIVGIGGYSDVRWGE